MKPELGIRRADKLGFQLAKEGYPFADILPCVLFGQAQVILIVARFGAQQRDIEAAQLFVQMGASLAKRSQERASM